MDIHDKLVVVTKKRHQLVAYKLEQDEMSECEKGGDGEWIHDTIAKEKKAIPVDHSGNSRITTSCSW